MGKVGCYLSPSVPENFNLVFYKGVYKTELPGKLKKKKSDSVTQFLYANLGMLHGGLIRGNHPG